MANQDLIVPRFFIHTVQDQKRSKEEGRPIFKDIECVEIRMAANKVEVRFSSSYPAFPAKCTTQPARQCVVSQECQSRMFKAPGFLTAS